MRRSNFTADMDSALTAAWHNRESMDALEKRTGISRSVLYRRAGVLGFEEREPNKRGPGGQSWIYPVPSKAHPLVKRLFDIMNKKDIPLAEVADEAGMTRRAMTYWIDVSEPKLYGFEACLNVLGYELIIRRKN